MATSLCNRKVDLLYVIYFSLLSLCVFMDSHIILPEKYHLECIKRWTDTYITTYNDVLVGQKPDWLQAFVWLEVFLQAPCLVIGIYGLVKNCPKTYLWIMVYGLNAAITTYGCVYVIWAHPQLTFDEKLGLSGFYGPTLIVPTIMTIDMFKRVTEFLPSAKDLDEKKRQ